MNTTTTAPKCPTYPFDGPHVARGWRTEMTGQRIYSIIDTFSGDTVADEMEEGVALWLIHASNSHATLTAENARLREALTEIAAWVPSASPSEPGGMSIIDAIDTATAALRGGA